MTLPSRSGGDMHQLRRAAACLLLTFCFPAAAFAQEPTGEIHRTVFDPSHTAVPKAEITVTDTATGISKTFTSGADGSYLAPNLLDGTYSISVTASGFEKSEYSGVVVDAGRITDMPLTLKFGAVSETVHR
jgi:hypothetical protein